MRLVLLPPRERITSFGSSAATASCPQASCARSRQARSSRASIPPCSPKGPMRSPSPSNRPAALRNRSDRSSSLVHCPPPDRSGADVDPLLARTPGRPRRGLRALMHPGRLAAVATLALACVAIPCAALAQQPSASLYGIREGTITYTLVHKLHEVRGTSRKLEGLAKVQPGG